jgi:hypothetical protein
MKDKPKAVIGSWLASILEHGPFEPLDSTPTEPSSPGDDDSIDGGYFARKRLERLTTGLVIEHGARLARLEAQRVEPAELPTIDEFRKLGTLTQKQAAQYLRRTPRMIRAYIQKGELLKAKGGRVKCDDKWVRKLRATYPELQLK